jgi:sortase A
VVGAAYVAAREIAGGALDAAENTLSTGVTPQRSLLAMPQLMAAPLAEPITEEVGIGAPTWRREPAGEVSVPWVGVPGISGSRERSAVPVATVPQDALLGPPRWATVFTWVRNIGAIVLLFVAWQLWGTSIGEHHEQAALKSQFEASVHAHAHHTLLTTTATTAPALIPADATVQAPVEGSVLAHLSIPAIGVSQFVVSGTATGDLAKGPGHYTGTAMPGQAGNVVIAGHRTTHGAPFNKLGDVSVGNTIVLSTLTGQNLTYVVSQAPFAVSPGDVTVLNDFGDNRITLTTCNPEFSARQRLIVVAELKQTGPNSAAVPVVKSKPIAYHIVNPATASWNWGLLPVVLLEIGFLVALGLLLRRLQGWYGGFGQWLILVPVWVAGLYLLFQSLTTFLPASI